MAERNERKVQTGKVVSDKMDKTIVVAVETYKNTTCTTSGLNIRRSLKLTMRTMKRKLATP